MFRSAEMFNWLDKHILHLYFPMLLLLYLPQRGEKIRLENRVDKASYLHKKIYFGDTR